MINNNNQTCGNCLWWSEKYEVCVNPRSVNCADFTLPTDTCEFWEIEVENEE